MLGYSVMDDVEELADTYYIEDEEDSMCKCGELLTYDYTSSDIVCHECGRRVETEN